MIDVLEYGIAQLSDCGDVVRLLAAVFSESEPLAAAMGLSFRDMELFLQLLAPRIIPQGLTVLARTKDTRKIAGVLLTDDFASPTAVNLEEINLNFRPILSMLEALDEQFRRGTIVSSGECLHLFMLGVDGQFAGRGIAQGLVKACLDNGFRKGYRMAITEATGRISQQVFQKEGFRDRFSMAYEEFAYEDKPVFASIQKHERAILMDRPLP